MGKFEGSFTICIMYKDDLNCSSLFTAKVDSPPPFSSRAGILKGAILLDLESPGTFQGGHRLKKCEKFLGGGNYVCVVSLFGGA